MFLPVSLSHLHESQQNAGNPGSKTPYGAGGRTPARPGYATPGRASVRNARTPNPYGGTTPANYGGAPNNFGAPPPQPPYAGYQTPRGGYPPQPSSMNPARAALIHNSTLANNRYRS